MSRRTTIKTALRPISMKELVSAVAGAAPAKTTSSAILTPQRPATPARQPRLPADHAAAGAASPPEEAGFLERNAPPVVGVTYWFDPLPRPRIQSAVLEIDGDLVATGPAGHGGHFHHEETVREVVAGSGPIAVTVKIQDVPEGDWNVKARVRLRPANQVESTPGTPENVLPARRSAWSWRGWRLVDATPTAVHTRLAPLVPAPAVLLGSWAALVVLGFLGGLALQIALATHDHLRLGPTIGATLLVVVVGIVTAKVWYRAQNRRDGSWQGWCLQGFVTGVAVSAPVMLRLLAISPGPYLDATAPALLLGAAIGRLGCFLTGCCAGRPTASRWAIWSSNRSVGARRVPTQLLESTLALLIGVASLITFVRIGARHGELLVAALAGYTLGRQALLPLREEPRKSRLGPRLVAALAAITLLGDLATIALR